MAYNKLLSLTVLLVASVVADTLPDQEGVSTSPTAHALSDAADYVVLLQQYSMLSKSYRSQSGPPFRALFPVMKTAGKLALEDAGILGRRFAHGSKNVHVSAQTWERAGQTGSRAIQLGKEGAKREFRKQLRDIPNDVLNGNMNLTSSAMKIGESAFTRSLVSPIKPYMQDAFKQAAKKTGKEFSKNQQKIAIKGMEMGVKEIVGEAFQLAELGGKGGVGLGLLAAMKDEWEKDGGVFAGDGEVGVYGYLKNIDFTVTAEGKETYDNRVGDF